MSDATKVWIVFRQSGSYEDYERKSIVAYLDEGVAEEHRRLASDAAKQARERFEDWDAWKDAGEPCTHHDAAPFDPGDCCRCSDCVRPACLAERAENGYTMTGYEGFYDWNYAVDAVELRDSVPLEEGR